MIVPDLAVISNGSVVFSQMPRADFSNGD